MEVARGLWWLLGAGFARARVRALCVSTFAHGRSGEGHLGTRLGFIKAAIVHVAPLRQPTAPPCEEVLSTWTGLARHVATVRLLVRTAGGFASGSHRCETLGLWPKYFRASARQGGKRGHGARMWQDSRRACCVARAATSFAACVSTFGLTGFGGLSCDDLSGCAVTGGSECPSEPRGKIGRCAQVLPKCAWCARPDSAVRWLLGRRRVPSALRSWQQRRPWAESAYEAWAAPLRS